MPAADDSILIPLFKNHAVLNEAKTAAEGRPIYDDVEVVEIRAPGSRNTSVQPANAFAKWDIDPHTGRQIKMTYAERFRKQYEQFKAHAAQTKSGTLLSHLPFLTEAKRMELQALNIYTAEALAAVDGLELKNLGYMGRDLKNKAIEYIAERKANVAPDTQMLRELEALRARNRVLEEDQERARKMPPKPEPPGTQFTRMTSDELRAYILEQRGEPVQGDVPRGMLVRMAIEAQAKVG